MADHTLEVSPERSSKTHIGIVPSDTGFYLDIKKGKGRWYNVVHMSATEALDFCARIRDALPEKEVLNMAHDAPDGDLPSLLNDLNADLSDALEALEKGDISASIGLLKGSVNALREALDVLDEADGPGS